MPKDGINKIYKGGEKFNKIIYGNHLEFRNRIKYTYDQDTEDDFDVLIKYELWHHPELAAEFPEVLIAEYLPGYVDTIRLDILTAMKFLLIQPLIAPL